MDCGLILSWRERGRRGIVSMAAFPGFKMHLSSHPAHFDSLPNSHHLPPIIKLSSSTFHSVLSKHDGMQRCAHFFLGPSHLILTGQMAVPLVSREEGDLLR